MNIQNFMARDKGTGKISVYPTEPYFLDVDYDNNYNIIGWHLYSNSYNWVGKTAQDLVDRLESIIELFDLTDKYIVKTRVSDPTGKQKTIAAEKESDSKHDYIIIYVKNLKIARGIFKNVKIDVYSNYLIVMDYFDIRTYTDFGDQESIKKWYTEFVDESRAYLSPAQAMRKRLLRSVGQDKTAKSIYPPTIRDYRYERRGIHGGVIYAQDSSGHVYDRPMLALDLTSAYIFGLLIRKHCMSERKAVPVTDWENYLGNSEYGSIGTYIIEYSFMYRYIRCFKDFNGNQFKIGHNEVTVIMDNIALNTFINLPHMVIHKIECLKLNEFKVDYMPQYYRDFAYKLYADKQALDRNSIEYKNHKVYLNSGVYGNILTDIFKYIPKEKDESESHYRDRIKKHYYKTVLTDSAKVSTIPLWGVYTLSYTKQLVFELATQLVGWRYSDTDSIYCDDTPENRAKLEAFNSKIRAEVKQFCNKFGYDYNILQDLGTFKKEAEIIKFRSFGVKMYAYRKVEIDDEGKIVETDEMHFAGCTYEQAPANLWSEAWKPTAGNKLIPYLDKNGDYRERHVGAEALMLFTE